MALFGKKDKTTQDSAPANANYLSNIPPVIVPDLAEAPFYPAAPSQEIPVAPSGGYDRAQYAQPTQPHSVPVNDNFNYQQAGYAAPPQPSYVAPAQPAAPAYAATQPAQAPYGAQPYANGTYAQPATPAYTQAAPSSMERQLFSDPISQVQEHTVRAPRASRSAFAISNPRNFNDIKNMLDSLRKKEIIVIDFAGVDKPFMQRALDFMSGGVYVAGGTMTHLKELMYVLVPEGCNVKQLNQILGEVN